MKKIILVLALFPMFIGFSQNTTSTDTTTSMQPNSSAEPNIERWYYGGTIGFNFWSDYFYLSVNPFVGYKITPEFSVGGRLQYAYINDKRYDQMELKSNNYGMGIFTRYRPIYQLYFHLEFDYANYENFTVYYPLIGNPYSQSERDWVPFLLVGGGYVQRIGQNSSFFIEVLFDVIQDDNSPYENWEPVINIGAGVGF